MLAGKVEIYPMATMLKRIVAAVTNCSVSQLDMSLVASLEPVDWILMSFDWDNTPEGGEFWEELNSKWYKELMG